MGRASGSEPRHADPIKPGGGVDTSTLARHKISSAGTSGSKIQEDEKSGDVEDSSTVASRKTQEAEKSGEDGGEDSSTKGSKKQAADKTVLKQMNVKAGDDEDTNNKNLGEEPSDTKAIHDIDKDSTEEHLNTKTIEIKSAPTKTAKDDSSIIDISKVEDPQHKPEPVEAGGSNDGASHKSAQEAASSSSSSSSSSAAAPPTPKDQD